ncbi:MAG: hypothetical protein V7711_13745 [Pseudomonadales bacterium]
MKRSKQFLAMILTLFTISAGGADEFVNASQALCQKVKSCARESIAAGAEIPPDMIDMVEQMLAGMCVDIEQRYEEIPSGHPLYAPATQCMQSIAELSCQQFENLADSVTPECAEYETQIEAQQD